jgi:YD repeat-containing protein
MLTQVAQTINYKTDIDLPAEESEIPGLLINYNFNKDDIIGSKVITWSNQFDLDGDNVVSTGEESTWRQNDTYSFIGDATDYQTFTDSIGDPGDFITNTTTGNNIWKRTSNIENYDRYSHPTEEIGIDGIYTSAIYGYEDVLPTAIVSNAEVNEIGYESYEKENDINGWPIYCEANQQIVDTEYHNGKHSIEIISSIECDPSTGSSNMIYKDFPAESLDLNKKYTFSAWVKAYQIDECIQFIQLKIKFRDHNGVWISPEQSQAQYSQENLGEWTYLECSIDLSQYSSQYSIILVEPYIVNYGSSEIPCYIDDIRFYPSDANMSTYTYDPLTWKLTSITDANNVSSYFEYDDAGRLVGIYDQDERLRKEYDYEFGRNQE